jgi:hypothetical protein
MGDDGLDYGQMRAFLLALASFVDTHLAMVPPMRPLLLAGLERNEASFGPKVQLKGVRMAVGDLLEMTRDLTAEQVAKADATLAAEAAPTLSVVRTRFWRKVPKILARGKIRNEVEYYLVIERVNDTVAADVAPPHVV